MIQNLKKLLLILCIGSIFVACESEEDDLIFQAENCINEKSGTGTIGECQPLLSSLSSPRANTLKCKIKLEMSGFSNQKLTSALDAMENDSSSTNEAEFMALVSLNSIAEANETAAICTNTESPGLEVIADSARMGTYFVDKLVPAGTHLGNIDADTVFTGPEVTQMLGDCKTDPDPGCRQAVGATAGSMYNIYCVDADLTDDQLCSDVNAAIAAGGSDEAIGITLISFFEL